MRTARTEIKEVTLPAYAKINLDLRLLRKRPDGYHAIRTVFQQISLHDIVQIRIRQSSQNHISVKVDKPDIPANEDNLVWKAAHAFLSRLEQKYSVTISLQKSIPAGAGLGGGSSDAGAVLIGMNHLTQAGFSLPSLVKTGADIGADVPFFLEGGTALAEGIGDRLQSISTGIDYHILIVAPPIAISTKWAYANTRIPLTSSTSDINLSRFFRSQTQIELWKSSFRNDFENLIFERFPRLEEIKRELYQSGAIFASLSGTGSSVFGVYQDESRVREGMSLFRSDESIHLSRPASWGIKDVLSDPNKQNFVQPVSGGKNGYY